MPPLVMRMLSLTRPISGTRAATTSCAHHHHTQSDELAARATRSSYRVKSHREQHNKTNLGNVSHTPGAEQAKSQSHREEEHSFA